MQVVFTSSHTGMKVKKNNQRITIHLLFSGDQCFHHHQPSFLQVPFVNNCCGQEHKYALTQRKKADRPLPSHHVITVMLQCNARTPPPLWAEPSSGQGGLGVGWSPTMTKHRHNSTRPLRLRRARSTEHRKSHGKGISRACLQKKKKKKKKILDF